MGTFYTLGIISHIEATSSKNLTHHEWIEVLNERVDTQLFDLKVQDTVVKARLQPNIFSENIVGFYSVLKNILGQERNRCIDYYENEHGTDLKNYQFGGMELSLQHEKFGRISLSVSFALLFIEGKVSVEEFYTEPLLINWLFRNSKIENKLAGCVISEVL